MITTALGQDIQDPEERKRFLHDNADKLVEMSYHKAFDSDELARKKTELSEVCIEINDIEDAKKIAMEGFKEQMKPLKESRQKLLEDIKSKGRLVTEKVYQIVYQEETTTAFYNSDGILISSRPATKDELSPTIFKLIREQA